MARIKAQHLFAFLLNLALVLCLIVGCAEKTESPKPKMVKKPKVVKPAEPLTAEMKVDKKTAKADEDLKYTVLIKNNTEKPMDGLKVTFVLPTGVEGGMRQEGGSKPTLDEQTKTFTWEVPTLQPNNSFWFGFTLTIAEGAPSGATISTSFKVEGAGLSKPVSSNTATTTVP